MKRDQEAEIRRQDEEIMDLKQQISGLAPILI
jgi:hypothetical protein